MAIGQFMPMTAGPSRGPSALISRTYGTRIYAGLTPIPRDAAAFDGNYNQAGHIATGIYQAGYLGKRFPAPIFIDKVVLYGPNNFTFWSAGSAPNVSLAAKNGSNPANKTDGTLLGSKVLPAGVRATDTIENTYGKNIPYDRVWIHSNVSELLLVAEMEIYGWLE